METLRDVVAGLWAWASEWYQSLSDVNQGLVVVLALLAVAWALVRLERSLRSPA